MASEQVLDSPARMGDLRSGPLGEEMPAYQRLLDGYLVWMREHQHAGESTLKTRRHKIKRFLESLAADATPEGMSRLTAEGIESFFLDYASEMNYSTRRSMQAALRTFLRFCFYKGYVPQGLEHAVPSLRTYKLARVSQVALEWPEEVTS